MRTTRFAKIFFPILLIFLLVLATQATTPGSDYIYECPQCSTLLKRASINSGNTFGAQFYSDGKMEAPMLPEFPSLTKCYNCDTILFIPELKSIGTCDPWDENCPEEWQKVPYVTFLEVDDLFRFLDLPMITDDPQKELYVRTNIWRTFNDRVRAQKELFQHEQDAQKWEDNCHSLLKLFDANNQNHQLIAAEVYRNLGQFDEALKILKKIKTQVAKDAELMDMVDQLMEQCNMKNTAVFEFIAKE